MSTQITHEESDKQYASRHHKTPGERFYDVTSFAVSNVCIGAATAGIALVAMHGKDQYGPVPNYLKKIMEPLNRMRGPWAEKAEETATALHNKVPGVTKADSHKADFKAVFGGSLAGTVVLWWGGTAFSPVMKAMENNREKIANWYNGHFGTKQDVQQAHENLKDEPKQNWGDVLKGRVVAFALVFSAFCSACLLLGRVKEPTDKGRLPLRFSWYEDKIGRYTAGFGKDGKDIANTPMNVELTEKQQENGLYRLGKIVALDFYATAMAVITWTVSSRKCAHKRQAKQQDKQAPDSGNASTSAAREQVESHPSAPDAQQSRGTQKSWVDKTNSIDVSKGLGYT